MLKRIIYTIVAALIIYVIVYTLLGKSYQYAYTDALFVTGYLITTAGLFVYIINGNMFGLFTFGTKKLLQSLKKNILPEEKLPPTYFDYIQERNDKTLKSAHLFIVGIVILIISYILAMMVV